MAAGDDGEAGGDLVHHVPLALDGEQAVGDEVGEDRNEGNEAEAPVQVEAVDEADQRGDDGADSFDDGVGDQLVEGVNVVGDEVAHAAGAIVVEPAEGQAAHLVGEGEAEVCL